MMDGLQPANQILFDMIAKRYNDVSVLKELSFSVGRNDFVALVGNNGCGKTTTINIMCNLATYDDGAYFFDGKKVTKDYVAFKNRLGIVLSTPYYIEEFNVIEYWKFVCKFQKVPVNEIKQRIEDLIQLLGLEQDAKKPIKSLSSGNQMKVSLGAALIHNPEVLVLDEPFVNLDIATTETIMNVLKGFKGQKTVFITSHQLELVVELCDRFLIMVDGNIGIELCKSDFSDINSLKEEVKKRLTQNEKNINLQWLR